MLMLKISHERGDGRSVDGTEVHRNCRIMWVMGVLHSAMKDFCVIGTSPRVMLTSLILSTVRCSLGDDQGCRKLAPLAPPVPDKSHLVGQNEILKNKILDIL